jgi:hypothetical protein
LISKGYKRGVEISGRKKKICKIGQILYLLAHRTLNLYVQYLSKILKFVRGGGGPPYFPDPDYSQKFLKQYGKNEISKRNLKIS